MFSVFCVSVTIGPCNPLPQESTKKNLCDSMCVSPMFDYQNREIFGDIPKSVTLPQGLLGSDPSKYMSGIEYAPIDDDD